MFDSGDFELGKADMLSDTSSSWSGFISFSNASADMEEGLTQTVVGGATAYCKL